MLTQSTLKQTLSYDPETGIFIWIKKIANCTKIGSVAGSKQDIGYLQINIHKKSYKAHRLAWLYMHGEFPLCEIDHINNIKTDNRLLNLRLATKSQNRQNRGIQSNNTSGYKGVSFDKETGKWIASANHNGKQIKLGRFITPDEASAVYERFASTHRGEFYFNQFEFLGTR
jgi:hypothetical protein